MQRGREENRLHGEIDATDIKYSAIHQVMEPVTVNSTEHDLSITVSFWEEFTSMVTILHLNCSFMCSSIKIF